MKIWTFKLISIALFINLISSLFVITFNNSVKIFESLLFVCSQFSTIQSWRVFLFKKFFPWFSPCFALFVLFILELVNFFFIIPDSLRSKDLLLLHSLLSEIGLINLDWLDEPCSRFERVEKDHKVFGCNVHPIIITKSKPFSSFYGRIFYDILLIIRPHLRNFLFLILQHFLNRHIGKWRRLLIILLHPLPQIIRTFFLLFLFLIIFKLLIHFLSILLLTKFFVFFLLWVVILFFINFLILFCVKFLQFFIFFLFGLQLWYFTTIFVDFGQVLECWICQHLTETIVDLDLCHLFLWTQKSWIIWSLCESLICNWLLALFLLLISRFSFIGFRFCKILILIWFLMLVLMIRFGDIFIFEILVVLWWLGLIILLILLLLFSVLLFPHCSVFFF